MALTDWLMLPAAVVLIALAVAWIRWPRSVLNPMETHFRHRLSLLDAMGFPRGSRRYLDEVRHIEETRTMLNRRGPWVTALIGCVMLVAALVS
jgi:hypothetical protein